MTSSPEKPGYSYPDPLDQITHGQEPFPGYWELSESALLDAYAYVVPDLFPRPPRRLLDAGCGDGRLLRRFTRQFEEITALDPDESRLLRARQLVAAQSLPGRITFSNQTVETYEDPEGFDCVWCGWVLEHVHTDLLPALLSQLASLLRPYGVILLATSHSRIVEDRFTRVSKEQGVHHESAISAAEFNSLLTNDDHILPIHQFSYAGLEALLETNGLRVLSHRVFHELKDFGYLDRVVFRDWLINLHASLRNRMGEDQFLLCAPTSIAASPALLKAASGFDKFLDHSRARPPLI